MKAGLAPRVSAHALNMRFPTDRSFAQNGTSPQRIDSIRATLLRDLQLVSRPLETFGARVDQRQDLLGRWHVPARDHGLTELG